MPSDRASRPSRPAPRIGRVARLLALRSFSGWNDLPAHDLAVIASFARPERYAEGEILLAGEEPVETIFLVVEGRLSLRRHGREIGRYGPRSAVGSLAAFADVPHGYECVALRDSVVLAMDADDLEEVLEERFAILTRVMREVARESIATRRQLRDGGFDPPGDGEAAPDEPIGPVDRIFYLRRSLGFGPSRIDSLAALAMEATELRLPVGEALWSEGDRADAFLVIVSGRVAAGCEGARFAFGPGDLVGAFDAVAGAPRWYDAEVSHDLVALRLDTDRAFDLWEDHPDLAFEVLRRFSAGLLDLLGRGDLTDQTVFGSIRG